MVDSQKVATDTNPDLLLASVHLGVLLSFELPTPRSMDLANLSNALKGGGFSARWADPLAKEFAIAEEFLLPREKVGEHLRQELDGFEVLLQISGLPEPRRIGIRPVLTVYPSLQVAILTLFAHLQECSVDDVVFLMQSILAKHNIETRLPALFSHDRSCMSDTVTCYLQRIRGCIDGDNLSSDTADLVLMSSRVIELRLSGSAKGPAGLIEEHPRELYGLLCADEGWRFVPNALAADRLARSWTTREHLRVVTFGHAVLLVDSQYDEHNEYVQNQHRVRQKYGVCCEEYFALVPCVAGVNHGPLLILEACTVRASCLLQIRRAIKHAKPRSITDLHRHRNELNDRLNRLNLFGIREIGLLEDAVTASMSLDGAMDEVLRSLSQIEAELSIRYTQRVNTLLIILTVLGALWTAIGSLAAVAAIFLALRSPPGH